MTREQKLEEALRDVRTWADSQCPCHEETPNPCTLCGASVENLEACKSVESIFPRELLRKLDAALAAGEEAGGVKEVHPTEIWVERRIADAIEACSWADVPIGNKAILQEAVSALRRMSPTPSPIVDDAMVERAARNALMYLKTGFIECDHCGHEIKTNTLDAVYELNAALSVAREGGE